MDKLIVSNPHPSLKCGGYKTQHESLCAKLHQAQTFADIASGADITDKHLHQLMCALSDTLEMACEQSERLEPSDFDIPDEKTSGDTRKSGK